MPFDDNKIEIFKELINIGVGKAGATLNQLLACHVQLNVPNISVIYKDEFRNRIHDDNEMFSSVEMKFSGPFNGSASLLFNLESASRLVSALIGDDVITSEMDEIKSGALSEVGNILLNNVMGSISNIINEHFAFSVVEYFEGDFRSLFDKSFGDIGVLIVAETNFDVPPLNIAGQINILMSWDSFEFMEKAFEKEFE